MSLWHYRSSGLQVSVIETACLWLSGTDRGKSVGLCGLYGLPQTTTDIGNFPDQCLRETTSDRVRAASDAEVNSKIRIGTGIGVEMGQ